MADWRDFGGRSEVNYEIGDVEIFCPCGESFFMDFDLPRVCPHCGRQYKAEVSLRVYYREGSGRSVRAGGGGAELSGGGVG